MAGDHVHEVIAKFVHLVEAPYGEFHGIAAMAQEIMDQRQTLLLAQTVMRDPMGAQALREQPRLGHVFFEELLQLPEGSLGHRYAHHMVDNHYDPPPILPVTDAESYFIAHLVEVHDVWHVVTGWKTDKAGEIGLQGFYLAQLYPSSGFLALVAKNLLKTALEDVEDTDAHMRALVTGWVQGKHTRPLFGADWKALWPRPLAEIRAQFGFHADGAAGVVLP
jgi:ubiquinone biosynthesis protein Coq4